MQEIAVISLNARTPARDRGVPKLNRALESRPDKDP